MKKQGFTLVELMGVLVVIGLLSLIIIPITSNLLKKQKEDQYAQQITSIELSAKNFGSDNLVILPSEDDETMQVTVGQLKGMGYINETIINPITNKEISNCAQIKITRDGNNYKYEYDKSTEEDYSCGVDQAAIVISAPNDEYIKKGETSSYLITINDTPTNDVISKYEIVKNKISLTGNTDAIYTIVEGNGIYRVILKGGDIEGKVKLKLESGAFLKNEIEDLVGSNGMESDKAVTIDNTIPEIVFGTDGNLEWSPLASSMITVSDGLAGGDVTTYRYTFSNSTSATPNNLFVSGEIYTQTSVTGDYYLIASACDKSGNCTSKRSNVFKVDNTPPTITFGTNGNPTWSTFARSTITVSDAHSGGDTNSYKFIYSTSNETPINTFISGGSYPQSTGSGDYYLIAQACDNAGNCDRATSNVFKLDNEPPTTPQISASSYVGNSAVAYVEDTWTKHNVFMNYLSIDYKVGGVYYQYSHGGDYVTNNPDNGFSSSNIAWEIGWNSYYIYYIRACDALGNCSEADSIKIKIDKYAPTISSTSTSTCSSNKRTITINASDPNVGETLNSSSVGSGIQGYAITSSTTAPASSSFNSITASSWTSGSYSPGTYYAWVKDAAGNISSYSTVTVGACDSEGPVITFGTNGSSSYVSQASTKVTVTDASAISSINYGWSTSNTSTSAGSTTTSGTTLSNKCSRTTDGDCYLFVKACDVNGNCSTKRTSAFKLDVTAPSITNLSHWSCKTGLGMRYTAKDTGSGVVQYGHIYCDKDLDKKHYTGYCYDCIDSDRLKTITATTSALNRSGTWDTCNTSGSDQPEASVGYSFWAKAIDAVGNVGKADDSTSVGDIKPYNGTSACGSCS